MDRVKGTKITQKLAFVREVYGDQAVTNVVAALKADQQQALRSVFDSGWYAFDLYESIIEAIVTVAADGDPSVLERIGVHGANRLSQKSYRVYYRKKEPLTVLEKMVPLHTVMNDPGEMEVVAHNEHQVSIVVRAPRSSSTVCRVAAAFYRRSVEICGVHGVEIEETECQSRGAGACRFEIRWEKAGRRSSAA